MAEVSLRSHCRLAFMDQQWSPIVTLTERLRIAHDELRSAALTDSASSGLRVRFAGRDTAIASHHERHRGA
jgi:hypothetical protein